MYSTWAALQAVTFFLTMLQPSAPNRMPDIRPFHSILYNPALSPLPDVLSPPADHITPGLEFKLSQRHPHNAVRLILTPDSTRAKMAAHFFDSWMADGILYKEPEGGMYAVSQTFKDSVGTIRQHSGIVALCRLEEPGTGRIIPIEATLPRRREEAFTQLQMSGVNLTPVTLVFNDPEEESRTVLREAMQRVPLCEIESDQVIHRIWVVTEPSTIEALTKFMLSKPVWIAEGHHRYEAALTYRDMMRLKITPFADQEPSNYVLAFFTTMENVNSLPVHRLVSEKDPVEPEDIVAALAPNCKIRAIESREQLHLAFARRAPHTLAFVHRSCMMIASLQEGIIPEEIAKTLAPEIRHLDVAAVHNYILPVLFGLEPYGATAQRNISYCVDVQEALDKVDHNACEYALIMSPLTPDDISLVVRAGVQLPPQSTYFFPYLPSGLIMRKLDEYVQ